MTERPILFSAPMVRGVAFQVLSPSVARSDG